MLLWLEERIKIPEGALHPSVCTHLLESHQQQVLTNLAFHLIQQVQAATHANLATHIAEVERLELAILPRTISNHIGRDLCCLSDFLHGEVRCLFHRVNRGVRWTNHLPLLEVSSFLVVEAIQIGKVGYNCVVDFVACNRNLFRGLVNTDPLVLHCSANTCFGCVVTERLGDVCIVKRTARLQELEDLCFWTTFLEILRALSCEFPAFSF
mmetsp:Transcript_28485/g.45797  ORF Transcript_28485/g.45797 Transcript_28485/m.45797 type:complete len:210 (-) Transcript_28485:230-859(-)